MWSLTKASGSFAIVLCVMVSACDPAVAPRIGYAGQWSGTTAQGRPITFSISPDERVTAITVGYSFNGCSGSETFSGLDLNIIPDVTCIPGPCPPAVSSYRAFNYSAGRSIDEPRISVHGIFPSLSRAEGVVGFADYPVCGTALGIGWTATRR